ncbi:MAG: protein kinase domain-containing protein [Anaerolineae bacterium]
MSTPARVRCPKCNYPNPAEADRCVSCGLPLWQTCPTCCRRRPWHVEQCPYCHQKEVQEDDLFLRLFQEPAPKRLRDRYLIQRELSRGRARAVYLARDEARGGALVAVKAFSDQSLLTSEERRLAVETFQQTVARWAALDHPALPRILETFSRGRQHYLVMEHLSGRSLEEVLDDASLVLREETAINWTVQLCDLLAYLHSQDPPLLFANLKPSHLLVEASGRLRAVGWNLDYLFLPWEGRDPRNLGTPGYAAPEQETGTATPASDVYAAGRILYALLTRQHLTAGQRLRPLRQVNPSISPQVEEAVARACRADVRSRTASATAFRRALLEGRQAPVAEGPAPVEELTPYRFSPTQSARDLADLVRLCQEDWERGRRQFFAGEISRWLQAQAEQLRRSLQTAQAERLSLLAESAERARRETSALSPTEQDVAFARWLTSTGYVVGKPVLRASTQYLKLGTVPVDRKLKASFHIHNAGNAYLFGRITSEVPWLRPVDAEFGCAPDQSVKVSLLVLGDRLPPQGERNPQALRVESNAGRLWIGAQAAPPEGQLVVTPQELDFGTLDASQGEATAVLRLANAGGQPVRGQVRATLPWLQVEPNQFLCLPGQAAEVRVRLDAARTSPGTRVQPGAILVDSDAGQASVTVRWTLERPQLSVSPSALHFGPLPRGRVGEVVLQVRNEGTGRLVGKVVAHVPGLDASPATFACQGGEAVQVRVRLATEAFPLGRTDVPEALEVVSNGGRKVLPLRAEVQGPLLEVELPWLSFGVASPGDALELALPVTNRGALPLEGCVQPLVAWLQAEPETFAIPPGGTLTLRVLAQTAGFEQGVILSEPQALRLETNGGRVTLGAGLTLLVPELHVSPTAVDFGPVLRTEVAERKVTVANRGTGVLEWQAGTEETWLEIAPQGGTLGPGREEEVLLRAYPLGLPAEATSARGTVQIGSNGGQVFLEVAMSVASPLLFLASSDVDLGTSDNYAPLEETLRLFNRGTGTLRGEALPQAPWLSVEPAEFACEMGMNVPLRLAVDPVGLPPEVEHAGTLFLRTNGGEEEVTVRFRVRARPILKVEPGALDLRPDPETGDLAGEVLVQNEGFGVLDVHLQCEPPWVQVPRSSYRVRRGRPVHVRVALSQDAPPEGESLLTLSTEGQQEEIPVRWHAQ